MVLECCYCLSLPAVCFLCFLVLEGSLQEKLGVPQEEVEVYLRVAAVVENHDLARPGGVMALWKP